MKEADNGIGYFGKGWASFKGGKVPEGWLPPENSPDALQEWVDGFLSADAEYPEESETGTQALSRIAPTVLNRCLTMGGGVIHNGNSILHIEAMSIL